MDYWFWGDVKRRVYNERPIESIETLKVKIQAAVREISAETRHAAIAHFRNRLLRCVENNGSHVEI